MHEFKRGDKPTPVPKIIRPVPGSFYRNKVSDVVMRVDAIRTASTRSGVDTTVDLTRVFPANMDGGTESHPNGLVEREWELLSYRERVRYFFLAVRSAVYGSNAYGGQSITTDRLDSLAREWDIETEISPKS